VYGFAPADPMRSAALRCAPCSRVRVLSAIFQRLPRRAGRAPSEAADARLYPSVNLIRIPADCARADPHAHRELTGLFEPPDLRRAQPRPLGDGWFTKNGTSHVLPPMRAASQGTFMRRLELRNSYVWRLVLSALGGS